VLCVACRATVAAGEDLAFAQQGLNHHLAGLLDKGHQHLHGVLLGVDAGLEELANTGLHVHQGKPSVVADQVSKAF